MFYNTITGDVKDFNNLFSFESVPDSKVLIAVPHGGEYVPSCSFPFLDYTNLLFPLEIDQFSNEIYRVNDYSFAGTPIHRHVVNLNKNKGKKGISNLFREVGFNGSSLYLDDVPNSVSEKLVNLYYNPFFNFVESELFRIYEKFDSAFLLNAHTMESEIPEVNKYLEHNKRPDFCLGTNDMCSIDHALLTEFHSSLESHARDYIGSDVSIAIDRPFAGRAGLTRVFGRPQDGFNALLLEINQGLYFSENGSDLEVINSLNSIIQNTLDDVF
jgi:N-formylglutamate amidohydrolase